MAKAYIVHVEKRLYCTGTVTISAKNKDAAIRKIGKMIDSGKLQTTAVNWNDPQYEDSTFDATGDVE